MTIGQHIRLLRKEKKMTQLDLSLKTGLSLSSIKSYEVDARQPNSKAMAALEQFFNVSGKYLRGETDTPDLGFKWNDEEINSAVNECLPNLFRNTLKASLQLDEHSKKMIFDIMVELLHTVTVENKNEAGIILGALQETFSSTTRFSDICIGFSQKTDYEKDRLTKAQASTLNEFQKTISDVREKLIK